MICPKCGSKTGGGTCSACASIERSSKMVLGEEQSPAAKEAVESFAKHVRALRVQQREAVAKAQPALERLVGVCRNRSGQSYHVRALLYSAWNGQAASLLDHLTGLDWAVRCDVLAVMLAFGSPGFFYDELAAPFKAAGMMEWFCEAYVETNKQE